jgi:hypothetical protein
LALRRIATGIAAIWRRHDRLRSAHKPQTS